MIDEIISFPTAILAKEKGFDETCDDFYNSYYGVTFPLGETHYNNRYLKEEENCEAPTQSLLAKWLREKHNIEILIKYYTKDEVVGYFCIVYLKNGDVKFVSEKLKTYEEPFELGLQEALKLI